MIAGGTGFIGKELTHHFLKKGDAVTILGRDHHKIKKIFGDRTDALTWNTLQHLGAKVLEQTDLVINLAGTGIAEKKWTQKRKIELHDSRILPTQLIAQYCAQLANPPVLFNASGVGIYGLQEPSTSLPLAFDEDTQLNFSNHADFIVQLAQQWEKATQIASVKGVRVVNMRFAVVLGKNGLLKKLQLPFSLGLGGPIGSGHQPFSWIAVDDLINAIDFLVTANEIKGPVNFVSPQCLTQYQFAQAFAKILHRTSFVRTPAFLIKLLLGEMGNDLLLNGQCAYPKQLLTHHFIFQYPTINEALQHIYKTS